MAQDDAGTNQLLHDHVNYLMSGPAGLGQNFSGYSAYTTAYLTGTFRQPFTVPGTTTPAPTWYANVTISNIAPVPGNPSRQVLATFSTTQATAPFSIGDWVYGVGIQENITSANTKYNGSYGPTVLSCTTSNVLIQTTGTYDWPVYISGGSLLKDYRYFNTTANIGNITIVDNYNLIFTFANTQATPPFLIGESTRVSGVTPSSYNDSNDAYRVTACTTANVSINYPFGYSWSPYVSGGTISNTTKYAASTDANARVTIYGPTDRVFISAQSNLTFTYNCSVASDVTVRFQINRYKAYPDTVTAGATDYIFLLDGTVSEQSYNYTPTTSGTQTVPESIFTSVIDSPSFGYYWYILDLAFQVASGDLTIGTVSTDLRGLTAQAVKQ
jgi:hypothetical protein